MQTGSHRTASLSFMLLASYKLLSPTCVFTARTEVLILIDGKRKRELLGTYMLMYVDIEWKTTGTSIVTHIIEQQYRLEDLENLTR